MESPSFMALGSQEREIPELVKPILGDVVLEKPTASIFIGTNFENMMRNKGVTTLLFAGIATEIGIESSACGDFRLCFFNGPGGACTLP